MNMLNAPGFIWITKLAIFHLPKLVINTLGIDIIGERTIIKLT